MELYDQTADMYVKLDALLIGPDRETDRVQLAIRDVMKNLKAAHEASQAHARSVASDAAVAAARFKEVHARAQAVLDSYDEQVHQRRT